MSISVVSNLVAASGGKAVSSALGESLSDAGLPQDFAAYLAEQFPGIGETLLASQASSKSDIGLLAAPSAKKGQLEESAENILAALSSNAGLPAANAIQDKIKGDRRDNELEADPVSDLLQTNPEVASQYVIQLPPAQRPLQDSDKPSDSSISSDTDVSLLPDQSNRNSFAQSTSAMKASELQSASRQAPSNAAILAGDVKLDNSSNTAAQASALSASGATNTTGKATPSEQPQPITSTLDSPNWSKEFGSRLIWMTKNDQQVAHININPPQLGPVQISISLTGDQANTVFTSPHAEVRQAIQDSLPQLREMLSASGINLGQADVGSQLPSQNREAAFQFANEARTSGENDILSPDSHASSNPTGIPIQRGRGLVDLFA